MVFVSSTVGGAFAATLRFLVGEGDGSLVGVGLLVLVLVGFDFGFGVWTCTMKMKHCKCYKKANGLGAEMHLKFSMQVHLVVDLRSTKRLRAHSNHKQKVQTEA